LASSHVPQLEDIWIHWQDEVIIRQQEFERLTLDEVKQYGIVDVSNEIEDDDDVLDP
ncbi:hypothetical protein KI387_027232, partial [Taxus chinensis]